MIQTITSKCFALRNNSATEASVTEPWLNPLPFPTFKNKDEYRAWCVHPTTNYLFFSMVEGEISSLRVGGSNKPFRLHGVVADYDCKNTTPEEIAKGLTRVSGMYPPFAWNRTFSGGVRMIWRFQEPVFFYNTATFKRFMARVKKELKLAGIFPALDDSYLKADQYYCAGSDWSLNPAAPVIGSAGLHLWLAEAAKNDDFDGFTEIPIEIVADQVEKQFPGRWQGEFKVGARGVRFWEAGADARSVIVRPTGVQAFTGDTSFLSWEAIFGRGFVQQFLENKMGGAIRDTWYDGKAYFRQLHNESWDAMNTEVVKRHLAVHYGLSTDKGKDVASEADKALHRIENSKRVAAALPFPHRPERQIFFNGNEYLNVATAKLWPAALDEQDWGENFPWLASYLSTLFETEEGLQVFLCWLSFWLKSLHEGKPCKGHAIFLVGPPGTGKTLLSTQILSRMVGGFTEATQYIVDANRYNNALFEKVLWTIDDALAGADAKAHDRFSSTMKACVANGTFRYERKFGQSGDVPFNGRLIVTLNDDPASMAIIPNVDLSLIDKVLIIRTGDMAADVAEKEFERYETIERELQYFVRWLLDFEFPAGIERDARFGLKAYADAGILEQARESTAGYNAIELVNLWRADWKESHSDQDKWEGTPSELIAHLRVSIRTKDIAAKLSPVWLGRHLTQAMSNGCTWISRARRRSDMSRILSIKL